MLVSYSGIIYVLPATHSIIKSVPPANHSRICVSIIQPLYLSYPLNYSRCPTGTNSINIGVSVSQYMSYLRPLKLKRCPTKNPFNHDICISYSTIIHVLPATHSIIIGVISVPHATRSNIICMSVTILYYMSWLLYIHPTQNPLNNYMHVCYSIYVLPVAPSNIKGVPPTTHSTIIFVSVTHP